MSKKYKTILAPMMLPIHFSIYEKVMRYHDYNIVILKNTSPTIIEEGLKYVHNDTCYPALVVIGQIIEALKSGQYDLETTAVTITQTGGGCRASNYLNLLRKALKRAGFGQVKVLSLNFYGMEKGNSIELTPLIIVKLLAASLYGDLIMHLSNQIRPYEINKGDTDRTISQCAELMAEKINHHKGYRKRNIRKNSEWIVKKFNEIEIVKKDLIKVGIVGEIFVKFSNIGNNNLEEFLHNEETEIRVPGMMGFINYIISQKFDQVELYGGKWYIKRIAKILYWYTTWLEKDLNYAIKKHSKFDPIIQFDEVRKTAKNICGLGIIMGEGWLLAGEMLTLCLEGFENIVCTQPFGCLPNHIVGKGMIKRIKELYPNANIAAIDYDPSATKVNQENRIKLMLSVAKEKQNNI